MTSSSSSQEWWIKTMALREARQAWILLSTTTEEVQESAGVCPAHTWTSVLFQLSACSSSPPLGDNPPSLLLPPKASLYEQKWGTADWASCWAACSSAPPPCSTWAWAASSAPRKATVTGGWSSTSARPIRTSPWTSTSRKTRPWSSSAAFPAAAPRWCAWCWTPTGTCGAARRPGWSPASWPCGPPGAARRRRGSAWTRPASPTRCWTRRCEPSCWRWASPATEWNAPRRR